MEFTINRDIFLKVLGRANGIIEKKTTLPILSNILIEAKSSKIKITVTDLDIIYFEELKPKEIKKEGSTTISANILYDILRKLQSNATVELSLQTSNKIKLISDGDVSGAISVAIKKFKIDIYIGIGGGPEGVLAAAALKCLNSQMQTRLVFQNENEKERSKKLGISDLNKKYSIEEMVKGDVIFCATGITDGELLKGIKSQSDQFESETYLLHLESKTNKIIKNITKK